MTWECENIGSETILSLGGGCGIGAADDLATRLKETLAWRTPLVTLDLGAVESVDITFLQILVAFQRSLRAQGRSLLLRALPAGHEVETKAVLLGLPLGRHFIFVEPTLTGSSS